MNLQTRWCAGFLWAFASVVPADGPDGVERANDAKAQLRKADETRRAIKGKGEARRDGAEKAARAYDAVLAYFPDAKAETSTAAFRLGELRRQLGDVDAARAAFGKVVTIAADRKLSARALLETGHLFRRAKELGKALESYRKAATEFADEAGTRDDSLYWIGSILEGSKEYDKAREAWQAVADRGLEPLDRVRAFDRIAGAYLKEGKRDDAAKTVEAAKTSLHDAASDPSPRGARVKKALERMRAIAALEKSDGPASKVAKKKGGGGGAGDGGGEDEDDDEDPDDDGGDED